MRKNDTPPSHGKEHCGFNLRAFLKTPQTRHSDFLTTESRLVGMRKLKNLSNEVSGVFRGALKINLAQMLHRITSPSVLPNEY